MSTMDTSSSDDDEADRTSRSQSLRQDVFPSQERLVYMDLGRDDLFGATNDSVSSTGSYTESLTESERERIQHIANVMVKMPNMNVS